MRLTAAFLLASTAPAAQTISGRVVNAVTGEPVRRASVALTRVDGPGTEYSALCDANGQFSISNLPPGTYRTTASRNGFLSPGPGKPFTFAAGQSISDLTLKLTPEAVVTGRIVDEEGEPMRNIFVSLQAYSYQQGVSSLYRSAGTPPLTTWASTAFSESRPAGII